MKLLTTVFQAGLLKLNIYCSWRLGNMGVPLYKGDLLLFQIIFETLDIWALSVLESHV